MSGIDQNALRYLYLEEHVSIRAIADGFSLHPEVIDEALVRWHITRPSAQRVQRSVPTVPFDETTLRDLYVDQQHTMQEIATRYGIRAGLVETALKYWQIPRRRPGPRAKASLAK